ncbi:STAS domain-containing protein [Sediminibacillus massiliensis]|uniref:STAS domain-containing protein n=1 Tax=Sediminibacillus massiliensis TaxID=1926277 RepID=UPI0009883DA0|nr:STAS domain-containing protein [Sediminibacillus massiliensis]
MSNSVTNHNASYQWQPEDGRMTFEGEDVIIFWIETAMKSFVNTIEEVSGSAAANIVMETAGFRMGQLVSDFFRGDDITQVIHSLTGIYASAGWFAMEVVEINPEEKKVTIRMRDSWEYKINRLQGKEKIGNFLPGHLAGTLTGLFEQNIGFEVSKSQIEGNEYDEVHYFPSEGHPVQDIHHYIRQQEQEDLLKLEQKVEERTKVLTDLVKEISSPIIPVLEGIVVIPLLGKYDEARAEDMLSNTLQHLPDYSANYLILDVTGLNKEIDDYTISLLQSLTNATKLLGTKSLIVGISPKLGIKLTETNFNLEGLDCFSTLKHAIHFALAQEGKQIIG